MGEPTLHRYVIPSVKHEAWGVFVIGSDGYFSCCTDFGNFAFWWSNHGRDDFRRFLVEAADSTDYLCGKLAPDEYDGPATVRSLEEAILRARRDAHAARRDGRKGPTDHLGRPIWTREHAREEWERLTEFELATSDQLWGAYYLQTQVELSYEHRCTQRNSDCMHMLTRIYPRLVERLRAELDAEAAGAAMGASA